MRFHVVIRYVALALILNSFFMLVCCIVSGIYNDTALLPLLYSAVVTALFGIFPLIFVPPTTDITNKEGLLIVVSSWLLSCLAGMLPYILWGGAFTFTNAWFESVSGYTTTGSSILINIEFLPKGLLLWRSATQWIGGIGIIIFVLSVLPYLGIAEMVLFRSEISYIGRQNFHQRARRAIQILVGVYIGLTFIESVALIFSGMTVFDAVAHSFATIATGGFSTKNASIAYYNSPAIEFIISIFMILSGVHFALLYSAVSGNLKNLLKSSIVKYYLFALVTGFIIVTINIHSSQFSSWIDSFRFASFQIISVGTSTGFATADSSIWPALSQLLLIFFTLQCACAGSTSGGIKVDRVFILGKAFIRHLKSLMHTNAVIPVKINDQIVSDDAISKSVLYVAVYILTAFIITLLLVSLNINILDAFSATVATMGNVGPGLGSVGSTGNFSHIPALGKWILSIGMLLGRLEIYVLIIFFTPAQWRKTITY